MYSKRSVYVVEEMCKYQYSYFKYLTFDTLNSLRYAEFGFHSLRTCIEGQLTCFETSTSI